MTFTQQLDKVLVAVRKFPVWDLATTYDCPGRSDYVVFHNCYRSAAAVLRSVIGDVANGGPVPTRALAESITNRGMGTDLVKVLVPHGIDPDADAVGYDSDIWHTLNVAEQDRILAGATQPIMILKDAEPDADGQVFPPAAEPSYVVGMDLGRGKDSNDVTLMNPFPPASEPDERDGGVTETEVDGGITLSQPSSLQRPAPIEDPAAVAAQPCEPYRQAPAHPPIETATEAVLDDDQAAFIVRLNLDVCVEIMKGRTAFNGAIGYVREAMKVCPATTAYEV